jgi:hypothetical protein
VISFFRLLPKKPCEAGFSKPALSIIQPVCILHTSDFPRRRKAVSSGDKLITLPLPLAPGEGITDKDRVNFKRRIMPIDRRVLLKVGHTMSSWPSAQPRQAGPDVVKGRDDSAEGGGKVRKISAYKQYLKYDKTILDQK